MDSMNIYNGHNLIKDIYLENATKNNWMHFNYHIYNSSVLDIILASNEYDRISVLDGFVYIVTQLLQSIF